MQTPDCYSKYGAGDCGNCQYAEWCADSADLPLLEESGRFWPYEPSLDGWYKLTGDENKTKSRLGSLLGELLFELDCDRADLLWDFLGTMSALSREKPATYRVVRLRILMPDATYQELADELGMHRQGVEMHLQKCAELIPDIRVGLVNPNKKLRTNKETRFSMRCSGNSVKVFLDDAEILNMPLDGENSKTAPHMVDALNNIHWRRREALIEELSK